MCTDGQEGSSQALVTQGLFHARWEGDRYISRSQRAPAPPGSETFQQDVRAKGEGSCVSKSGDCQSRAGLLQECGAPPCPTTSQNGHCRASQAWVRALDWPHTYSCGGHPSSLSWSLLLHMHPTCGPTGSPTPRWCSHPLFSGPGLEGRCVVWGHLDHGQRPAHSTAWGAAFRRIRKRN